MVLLVYMTLMMRGVVVVREVALTKIGSSRRCKSHNYMIVYKL